MALFFGISIEAVVVCLMGATLFLVAMTVLAIGAIFESLLTVAFLVAGEVGAEFSGAVVSAFTINVSTEVFDGIGWTFLSDLCCGAASFLCEVAM